jgi:UDP-glucuronate decarboxylase
VQALRGEPLTIYGDGEQTRSFCYVSDLVDGIIKLLYLEDGLVTPINLGNPQEFTMLQLASEIIKITGSTSAINFKPLPLDDPKQRRPDITLAREVLNWEPQINLESGLSETIRYFEAILL